MLPQPHYVDLRSPDGRLLARYDPTRGILEIAQRGTKYYFDLTQVRLLALEEPEQTCYNFDR